MRKRSIFVLAVCLSMSMLAGRTLAQTSAKKADVLCLHGYERDYIMSGDTCKYFTESMVDFYVPVADDPTMSVGSATLARRTYVLPSELQEEKQPQVNLGILMSARPDLGKELLISKHAAHLGDGKKGRIDFETDGNHLAYRNDGSTCSMILTAGEERSIAEFASLAILRMMGIDIRLREFVQEELYRTRQDMGYGPSDLLSVRNTFKVTLGADYQSGQLLDAYGEVFFKGSEYMSGGEAEAAQRRVATNDKVIVPKTVPALPPYVERAKSAMITIDSPEKE